MKQFKSFHRLNDENPGGGRRIEGLERLNSF